MNSVLKLALAAALCIPATGLAASESDMASHVAAIQILAKKGLNCKVNADCTVVPVGTIPCGGPATFLAVSAKNKYLPAIKTLDTELVEMQRKYYDEEGIAGLCEVMQPPKVGCVQSKCSALGQ